MVTVGPWVETEVEHGSEKVPKGYRRSIREPVVFFDPLDSLLRGPTRIRSGHRDSSLIFSDDLRLWSGNEGLSFRPYNTLLRPHTSIPPTTSLRRTPSAVDFVPLVPLSMSPGLPLPLSFLLILRFLQDCVRHSI